MSIPSGEQYIAFNTPVKIEAKCSTVKIKHRYNSIIINNLLYNSIN